MKEGIKIEKIHWNKRLYLISCFISTLFLVCSISLRAQVAEKTFSRTELISDLESMISTINNIHPNPYHSITKVAFDKLTDSVKKGFKENMTAAEAWPLFSRTIAAFDEGHSTIAFPAEKQKQIQQDEIKIFPVLIKEFDGAAFVVRYDLSEENTLQQGDLINKINGQTATSLMEYLASFYGGLTNWRHLQAIRDFSGNLCLHKIEPPYKIEYTREGEKKQVVINGISYTELVQKAAELRKRNPVNNVSASYSFQRLENNTGYLDFRSMRDLTLFEKFLDSIFNEIKNNPVNGLIIDLRQNGGGNSVLGEKLIGYITTKPFRMGGGSLWKVSDEYKDFIRKQATSNKVYQSGSFQNYLNKSTGEMIKGFNPKAVAPPKNKLVYTGKVCVLIGPNTFSSANMLANAIKDYQLATLIGEPTGEPGNDYGELYWTNLPNTQLRFYSCVKQFIRANGNAEDNDPILPDITVKQQHNSNADDVLEFAKEWINRK